jgi:hypothetical protein
MSGLQRVRASCRAGGYLRKARSKRSLAERFAEKVNKNGPIMPNMVTPCHVWTASCDTRGYGQIADEDGKLVRATHVAWKIEHGEYPKNGALHHCDNPPCVRPDHLFDGTQKDNSADMIKKGRSPRGSKNSKYTTELVQQLREEFKAGGISQADLARKYGLLSGTLSRILRGTRWPA